ncbi:MAG: TPM domain-containing protein [Herminiimonas sp.]|nr:TPM domain-containing protein [Herminiimonas sp.]
MNKFKRTVRHLMTTTAAGKKAFPDAALKAIQKAIAEGEQQHRAEMRLIIEPALDFDTAWAGITSRQRARELFSQYGIWDTEENCGILVYINLADHKVEIIADRGVDRVLEKHDWASVCQTMTQGFARGEFGTSAVAGIEQLNVLLKNRFATDGSRDNQLSNRPLVL